MKTILLALAAVAMAFSTLSTAEAGGGGFNSFRFNRGFNSRGFNRGPSFNFQFNRGFNSGYGFQRNFVAVPRSNVVFFAQPSYQVQTFAAPAFVPSYGVQSFQFQAGGGYCGF